MSERMSGQMEVKLNGYLMALLDVRIKIKETKVLLPNVFLESSQEAKVAGATLEFVDRMLRVMIDQLK